MCMFKDAKARNERSDGVCELRNSSEMKEFVASGSAKIHDTKKKIPYREQIIALFFFLGRKRKLSLL
jgi:hypothetical protein